ncbi:FAD:protein FMN transferase [Confluentibacter flavum]|nr:FAD:protein FMN transferase [Confluentibacter flavum]
MGTQIGLVFYDKDHKNADFLAKLVFKRIDELNRIFSNYLIDSEINRLSETPYENVKVSKDLFRLLFISSVYSQKTFGSFDVTLGPLIELWKKAKSNKKIPLKSEIHFALGKTGHGHMEFPAVDMIKLNKEGMQLDVGGIGKGFVADEIIALLANHGVRIALVDMGGDITVGDPPPNKEYWTLGFSFFNENGEEVFNKLKLRNQAVATSGDLYQYELLDGKRYSHIIDPKSGMALSNNIQVTVIAPTGTMADAYASGISVLDMVEGEKVVRETPALEVYIIMDMPSAYKQWNSKGFLDYILEE